MTRWRRWLALAVLLLPLLFLLAPASEHGTRLLLGALDRAPGVSVRGVSGRLFGVLRIRQLAITLPSLAVTLEALSGELKPACLLRGRVCLRRLGAATVQVVPAGGAGGGGDGPPPALPFALRVDALTVGELRLSDDPEAVTVRQLALADLRAAGRRVAVRGLDASLGEIGQISGRAELTFEDGLAVDVAGVFAGGPALRAALPAGVALPAPVSVALAGPAAALAVEAAGPVALSAAGGEAGARVAGTLRWPRLDVETARVLLPEGRLQARGEVDLAAPAAQFALTLEEVAAPLARQWRLAPVSGTARVAVAAGGDPAFRVTSLRLTTRLGPDALTLAGRGGWRPGAAVPALDLTGSLGPLALRATGGGVDALRLALALPARETWRGLGAGQLDVAATLGADGGRLDLRLTGRALRRGALRIGAVDGEFRVDAGTARVSDGRLRLDDLRVGDAAVDALRLRGAGDPGAFHIDASLAGDVDGDLSLGARRGEAAWSLALEPLSLRTPVGRLARAQVLKVAVPADPWRVVFPAHCWSLEQLSLCLDAGEAGAAGELAGRVEGRVTVPPALLADALALGVDGGGEFALRYGDGAPSGRLSGDAALTLRAETGAEPLPDPGRLTVDLDLGPQSGLRAQLAGGALGSVTLEAEGDAERWRGRLALAGADLAYALPLLPPLARLEGTLRGELALASAEPALIAGGELRLEDGAIALRGNDARLERLALRMRPAGAEVVVDGDARLGGGDLAIGGRIDPLAPGFTLTLRGTRNAVHWPGLVDATVSPALRIGLAGGEPALSGTVRVHEGRLSPDRVGAGGVGLSPDTELVGADEARQRGPRAAIDLRLQVDERFRVVGDLVDATVGGDLRLRRAPGAPLQLFGRVNVVGGELRAYGQQLALRDGSMGFVGDPQNPELSLRAEREFRREGLRVGFTVAGSLREPRLSIYSEPQLSREAELSWLLRGRAPDAGASIDGSALALSVGASALNQSGVVRSLNALPGLRNVAIGTETSAVGTAATISGYVGDRLYLSYGLGLYEPVSTLTARLYLRARLWLEMVSALENSIDLYYRFDIE